MAGTHLSGYMVDSFILSIMLDVFNRRTNPLKKI